MTQRRDAALVVALALAVARTAAGADDALVTPVRVGRADAPLVLSVWAQQEYSHLAARPDSARVFTRIFEDYARAHPDVRLDVSVMPALELHKAKLLLAAAADRLPDVASIDSFWMPLFMPQGHVQPLDEHWPAEERADFIPFTIETLSDRSGHVYGMWHGTDCRILFYRKDLVPDPPETWDELLGVASAISRERGMAGYLFNAGRWEAAVFDHLPMFWGQGGRLVDADGRPIFGEPPHRERMAKVLAFLRRAVETGASPRSVLAQTDYQQMSSAAVAGDVAMFLGGNWQLRELRAGLRPDQLAKWDFAPMPQEKPGVLSTGNGGWIWVVFAKDPEKRRAAVEFLRFVESPANVAAIVKTTDHLPARLSVYRDFAEFSQGPSARFGELLRHARARPAVPIYPTISQELQLAIGYAVAGEKTPESAVDDAWRAVRGAYERMHASPIAASGRVDPVAWLPPLLAAAALVAALAPIRGGQAALRFWLAAPLVLVGALLLYPMLELVRLAFSEAATHAPVRDYTLASFRALLGPPEFRGVLGTTVVFVASSVALQMGLGLALAVLIDSARRQRAPFTLFTRVAVVSAWVVPGVLVGVLWRILLIENRSGVVNYSLSLAGLGPLPLLSSGPLAMASVIAANTWRGCAFSMILQFAGLQRIPRELHEAADLEGLSGWQRLRMLILPQLAPVLALNLALVTIATLSTFDLILPLTGGGPARATEVASLFMYRLGFYDLEAGRAAAVAVVMLALNVALAIAALRLILRPRRSA